MNSNTASFFLQFYQRFGKRLCSKMWASQKKRALAKEMYLAHNRAPLK